MAGMTPLQKIAMGLVIVLLDAYVRGFDAVPDALGWALVIAGLLDLRGTVAAFGTLTTLAGLAAGVSLALLWPGLTDSVTDTAGWALSLPQLGFCLVLCGSVMALASGQDPAVARRFSWLRWAFVALVLAPAVLYGGGVDALLVPIAVVTVVANIYLIYVLFRISKRPYALPHADVHPG